MAAAGMLLALSAAPAALAQKSRGVLRQYIIDSPASMSIHEETTVVAERPMMAVMSNLVLFDQHVPQNSLSDILPDLATDWAWDEDGTRLTCTCARASNGTMASRSPLLTSNALGIWSRARAPSGCASIRARLGTIISPRLSPTAITK